MRVCSTTGGDRYAAAIPSWASVCSSSRGSRSCQSLFCGPHGPLAVRVAAHDRDSAVTSFIFSAAHTPLSNLGVRRAEAWRAYQKQLREVPKELRRADWSGSRSPMRLLPFAVALGLAAAWSKIFKDRERRCRHGSTLRRRPTQTPGSSRLSATAAPARAVAPAGGGAAGGGASGAG